MPTEEPLRVAFMGGGTRSAVGQAHRIAIELDQRFKLVAGCFSANRHENLESARSYQVPTEHVYDNLKTLLEQESQSIDAIVILTPTPNHYEEVMACLEHAVPVICEKALAPSSKQILAIQKKLEAFRGYLAVTYNYSGYPMLRELRQMMERGALGEINQLHIEMPQEGFLKTTADGSPATPQPWRLKDANVATLSLDLGVHVHHLLTFLSGQQPTRLVATQHQFGNFEQVIDNMLCIAECGPRLVSNIWFSKSAIGHRNGLKVRVYGSKGSAEWAQMSPEQLLSADHSGNIRILDRASNNLQVADQARYARFKPGHPAGYIEAFANLYWDIADDLLQFRSSQAHPKNRLVPGLSESLDGLRMLEAMSASVEHNSWIQL